MLGRPPAAALALLLGLLPSLGAAPQPRAPQEGVQGGEGDPALASPRSRSLLEMTFHGAISARWRGRWQGSEHDNDMYTYVRIQGNDPLRDDVSLSVFARASQDLDGRSSGSDDPQFFSITDTFDHSFNARLYRAHIDFQGGILPEDLPLRRVRVGRQSADVGFTYLFDGISASTDPIEDLGELEFSFYGGLPVRFFESSSSGDWVAGALARARLTPDTDLEAELTHIRERFSGFDAIGGSHSSNYIRIELRHQISAELAVRGRYGILDGNTRDFEIGARWNVACLSTEISADLTSFVHTLEERSFEFDPYFGALGAYEPYIQVGARARTVLDSGLSFSEGFEIRQLRDEDDEGEFNREYSRFYATVSLPSWPSEHTELSFSADVWNADGDPLPSAGVELSYRPSEELDAALGTYYSLYKLRLFGERERQDVQTYYVRARHKISSDLRLDARYELEDADGDYFHSVFFGLSYSF